MVRYAVAYCDKDHPDNFMVDYGPAEGFATPCVALDRAETMIREGQYIDVTPFAYCEGTPLNWDYAIRHEMEFAVAYQGLDASGTLQLNVQTHLRTRSEQESATRKIAMDHPLYKPFVWLGRKERHTLHHWREVEDRDLDHIPDRLLD